MRRRSCEARSSAPHSITVAASQRRARASALSTAPSCGLGDLAGGDKCIDAALREFRAHGSHASLALRAVLVIGAAVSQVVVGASIDDGIAVSERLGGEKCKAD